MKTIIELQEGWEIASRMPSGEMEEGELTEWSSGDPPSSAGESQWLACPMPAQAHHVLVSHGIIRDPAEVGAAAECLWVGESDWVYRTQFDSPESAGRDGARTFLRCAGVDTIAAVYLNGVKITFHEDQFLPLRVDVTDVLRNRNTLLWHFHAPRPWLERSKEARAFAEAGGRMSRFLRKSVEDFGFFNGAKPWFTPIGIHAPVVLEVVDRVEIEELSVRAVVSEDFAGATVEIDCRIDPSGLGGGDSEAAESPSGTVLRVALLDPGGGKIAEDEIAVGAGRAATALPVHSPELWYPRNYGDHPLYTVTAQLSLRDEVVDETSKRVGMLRLVRHGEFDFSVNGKRVKLWGANLTPLPRPGHRHDAAAFRRTLDLAQRMNVPVLRVWGPSMPWPEDLLCEADQRGILLWIEFAHTVSGWPDNDHFRAQCRAEAEHWVRSWRHHPCILLYSGGNEAYLGIDASEPNPDDPDRRLFDVVYREVCERFDPDRWYIPNSPFGGSYGNDPRSGDSHIRDYQFFHPGDEFPVLPSENTRITVALEKTLVKHLGEDLRWPKEGFTGARTHFDEPAIPPAWVDAMSPNIRWINIRVGCQGELYDADGSPHSLLMRIGKGSSTYIRRTVERLRRGRPASDPHGPRQTMGYFWWKLNDTFPMIYASLIDDQLEPNMAYYAMRRAYSPVLVSVDAGDTLCFWVVNDTADDVAGTLRVRLLDVSGRDVLSELHTSVTVRQGESVVAATGEPFGMFERKCPLLVEFLSEDGAVLAECLDYVAPEREIPFPTDAEITLAADGDELVVGSNAIARWVELRGRSPEGDEFGWDFADNFFDVVPGHERRVKVLGRHRRGTVTARSAFSPCVARIDL